MDDVTKFFNFSKEFKRKTLPRGIFSGYSRNHIDAEGKNAEKQIMKTKLETQYMEQTTICGEMQTLLYLDKSAKNMDCMESLVTENVSKDLKDDSMIYQKYNFGRGFNEKLPVYSCKTKILNAIKNNNVVVLEGDTGCGKTTQVPQYILEEAFSKEEYCNIVVTQPRRIAAISVSKQVANERKWPEGSLVGFQVGLHSNMSEDTRLLYCTTGVLLQKVIHDKSFGRFTHIILDEVHERDQDMDFLLIVIRQLLMTTRAHIKVILMSATINANEIAQYFGIGNTLTAIVKIDQNRLFEVQEFYLESLKKINKNNANITFLKPGISDEMYDLCVNLIMVIYNIEKHTNKSQYSSILVFLPGVYAIDFMFNKLMELNNFRKNPVLLHLIRLHSLISPDEQIKVFRKAPNSYMKVVLSTNIAESSITVPDVRYVIDFCLTKVLLNDSASNFSSLELQWASRSNCCQRAGRAGRVTNGRVYRLIPKKIYQDELSEYTEPEMLRCPLEKLVLKCKLLDMGSPHKILGLALNPPKLNDIENTILKLKELNAMYLEKNNEPYMPLDGSITFIGRVMALLPLDVRLSRLILMGYLFSVLEDAIIIAAGLTVRSIFKSYSAERNRGVAALVQRLSWADNSGSDLLAILRAYKTWVQMRSRHLRDDDSEKYWANYFYINLRSMKEMHLLVEEIWQRLEAFGIRRSLPHENIFWSERERPIITKIVIAAAFYPNYFLIFNNNDVEFEQNIHRCLYGLDPCNTVYFTNFNILNIGPLYSSSIKQLFKCAGIAPENIEVRFPAGSEKVLVSFKKYYGTQSSKDGSLHSEISKSLTLRLSGIDLSVPILPMHLAKKYLQEKQIGTMDVGEWVLPKEFTTNFQDTVLPSLFDDNISGYITHIEDCSTFYFQPLSEKENVREIRTELRHCVNREYSFEDISQISNGMIVAVPFENEYLRAKILEIMRGARKDHKFKVLLIDYGNKLIVNFRDLRWIPRKMVSIRTRPGHCFQCRLALISPSPYKSSNGVWMDESMQLLQAKANKGLLNLTVYSVVNGIVNVILNDGSGSFNEKLVRCGLARTSDENFMSKMDHDLRLKKQKTFFSAEETEIEAEDLEYKQSCLGLKEIVLPAPPAELCSKRIILKGPYSPLERKMSLALRDASWKTVSIERDSVNFVLLDKDPQDKHQRLVVASNISNGDTGNLIIAHSTTLMPNIHGFGALMTLLFSPKVEIKTNNHSSKYVAILGGLGYNSLLKEAIYPEHDIFMELDVEIDQNDLNLVNQIRYCMDSILYTEIGDKELAANCRNRGEINRTLKSSITQLLNKDRKFIEAATDINSYWTNSYYENSQNIPDIYGKRSIFPFHTAPKLAKETEQILQGLNEDCRNLHLIRKLDHCSQPTKCNLCNISLENISAVRIHLLSKLHRDRETQISFKIDEQ